MSTSKKTLQNMPLQPLGDRVVVRPLPAEEGKKTASGIIIPDTVSKERPERGTVLAVGPGKRTEDGETVIPVSVSVGDEVLFSKYGPDEITVDGQDYFIIREDALLAVIKKN